MMIKKLLISAVVVAILGYMGFVLIVSNTDKTRSKNLIAAHQTAPGNEQVVKVIYQVGCDYCHTPKAELPFYASWPIAKQLMDHDVKQGLTHYLLDPLLQHLQDGTPPSEVDLAKIQRVLENETMPPMRYIFLHWRGMIDEGQRAILLTWIKESRQKYYMTEGVSEQFSSDLLQPLPEKIPTDALKVALGFKLFHDTRLSDDNTLSCLSCHDLNDGGVDHLVTSKGINGQLGPINAPTVFNAVFNIEQFWDGRAKDLQDQAGGPPMNPVEMGSTSWFEIIEKLAADPILTKEFMTVYPAGYSGDTITDAIAEFEKTLITPDNPFDRYLRGDASALTPQQISGHKTFVKYACDTCHVGKSLGGQSYELMGLKADYFADRGNLTDADLGRYGVTKDERDRYRFKTPNLRNIELTAPYLHDGSAKTLEEAVKVMMTYQVGEKASATEVKDMVEFLKSLTGKYEPEPLAVIIP